MSLQIARCKSIDRSIFLSLPTTLMLMLVSLCIQLFSGVLSPTTSPVVNVSPLFFTLVMGPLILIFLNHRAGLEQDRQAELHRVLQQQQELNVLKSRVITTASHEFRTPLATISSSTGLLERAVDKMSAEQRQRHFDKITVSVGQIVKLLDAALMFGQADSDRLDFKPEPMDLASFCQELLGNIHVPAHPTHQLTFSSTGTCPIALADKQLLRVIVDNLVSNAVKFSPPGSPVHVSLTCEQGHVKLQVEDHGIGIPQEDQKYLFEPFHRAENVGTLPGTGLGLALVKKAVKLHGGTVDFISTTVSSGNGSGTTFLVTFPLRPFDLGPVKI